MPYIKNINRAKFNQYLINLYPSDAGELNYCISMLVNKYIATKGIGYKNINEAIGVLECAKLEVYRRIASPYEDKKIKENGDILDKDRTYI